MLFQVEKGRKCSEQVSDQKNDLRVMFLKSISGPVVGSPLASKEAKCISYSHAKFPPAEKSGRGNRPRLQRALRENHPLLSIAAA